LSDNKSKSSGADWGFVGFDFVKLIEFCQICGVDVMSLIDTEKKTIDALIEINRSAYDSWRNLAVEARDEADVERRTEIARQGFERALASMGQLAETATESQKQTIEIFRRRFEDGIAAMRNQGGSA